MDILQDQEQEEDHGGNGLITSVITSVMIALIWVQRCWKTCLETCCVQHVLLARDNLVVIVRAVTNGWTDITRDSC